MKSVRRFTALLLLAILCVPAIASADTVSISEELHVQARVLPRQIIVIDSQGIIQTVTSNTTQDAVPEVYLETIQPENHQQLTDALFNQYRKIVPLGESKPGVIRIVQPPLLRSVTSLQPAQNINDLVLSLL